MKPSTNYPSGGAAIIQVLSGIRKGRTNDQKGLSKKNLAASIPDSHPLKVYFCNQLNEVINPKNYQTIQELYELLI